MWYVNKCISIKSKVSNWGFILTMWYVNQEYFMAMGAAKDGFYINYVICKYGMN